MRNPRILAAAALLWVWPVAVHPATGTASPPKSSTTSPKPSTPAEQAGSADPSPGKNPSFPASACSDLLSALPHNHQDPGQYLPAAACLRRRDSLAAIGSSDRMNAPMERNLRSRTGISSLASDSILRARLPSERLWFMTQMERLRVKRDIPRMLDMAYLTEAKALPDPDVFRQLAAVYQAVPEPYRAGLALLRQGELDSMQAGYIQYQLESLLNAAGSEVEPADLLDSLTAGFPHRGYRTAEILESLSWSNRNYPAAYKNLLARMALKAPGPGVVLERVNRLQGLGYFDYAAALLDKVGWRKLGPPWLGMGRTLHLQIRAQLQDWPAITAMAATAATAAKPADPSQAPATGSAASPAAGESAGTTPSGLPGAVTGEVRYPPFSDEETYIIGGAFLKLGMPAEALTRAKRLAEKGEAPWGFRGRLLKAQAQLALGNPKDAVKTLDALKKDPRRKEGTGPILFWQGCLALDQGRFAAAESLLVLASAYTGAEESQRALEYRFFMLLDTGSARPHFFKGQPESPHDPGDRARSLDRVVRESPLWPFAQLEKAQIHLQNGDPDSAEAVFDAVSKGSPDKLAGYQAEAKAAFTAEKFPGGRQAALARYEDLLIKYQQGVIPEFSRGRIKALK